jgi:photosystem II stability/assembly factor-like uncharacterized protein
MSPSTQSSSHTIHDIALSPTYTTDGIGYVASEAGLFRTANYSRAWESVGEPVLVTKILVTPDVVIAGCGGHIAKSIDKGKTWTSRILPLPTTIVSALAIYEDYILLGTMDDGVLRSDNYGEKWSDLNSGLLDLYILSLAVTAQGLLYVGTETGLFNSRNGGKSWQKTASNIKSPILSLATIEEDVLVATESGQLLRVSSENDSMTTLFTSDNAINALELSQNNHLAILDDTTIMVSQDSGQSWSQPEVQVEDVLALAWADDNALIVGSMNGILATVDIE